MSTAANTRPAGLRRTAARGTIINGAYLVFLNSLGFIKGFVAAALLTVTEYGVWGILSVTLIAALWLKEMGVADKFVQQREEDQERAFQHAFSVDLLLTSGVFALMVIGMPLLGLLYGEWDIVLPGLALALMLPALPLQAPVWLHYRELRFASQRAIQAVDPIVSFVITVGLALGGFGYWSLVIGSVVGSWATAAVAIKSAPYKLRWRLEPGVLRTYLGFSWPIFVAAVSGLIMGQLSIIVGEKELGLAAVAGIALAGTMSRYSQRLDAVLTQTLYPVVARVRDRVDLLQESFVKSNRIALIWAGPFGAAFGLFAADLVNFGLGDGWESAIFLLSVTGWAAILNQLGYNWSAYYRARGETRPIAYASIAALVVFCAVAIPLLITEGLDGYAYGVAAMVLTNYLARTYYLKRIFPALKMTRHALRSIAPLVPATLAVIGLRALESGTRTLEMAVIELAAFGTIALVTTLALERNLLRELTGYLSHSRPAPPPPDLEATS